MKCHELLWAFAVHGAMTEPPEVKELYGSSVELELLQPLQENQTEVPRSKLKI